MRVKICGITNLEDARHAIACGADALGFVFYPGSPRYIVPKEAARISRALPPFVERVGLFVHETPEQIDRICHDARMDIAQIHFEVEEAFLDAIEIRTLPVIRAQGPEDIVRFPDRFRLVDVYCEAYGGSGKRLNLEWFDGVACDQIILAGGLTPMNVHEVHPYGFYAVDVSSGTEQRKGIKDPEKVRQFIAHAKSL
jgi:phosphoribosylanthranilate isomerase